MLYKENIYKRGAQKPMIYFYFNPKSRKKRSLSDKLKIASSENGSTTPLLNNLSTISS